MRFTLLVTGLLSAALLVLPVTVPALAARTAPATVAPPHWYGVKDNARLQKVLDELVASGVPGVIAEVRDADGVWAGESGKGDLRGGRPPRADGLFRAGSVTKTFVATTVLQLVQEGRLGLDDPVERHLPGLLPDGAHSTVRQLLAHRSGLYNYTDGLMSDGLQHMYDTRFEHHTPRELVAMATAHRPVFAPGTDGAYSNTNYVVLGMLIEKITGNRPEKEIMARIVRPLRLHHTFFPTSPRIPGPHAHGYVRLHGPDSPYADFTESDMSWAWTAGAMISTTHDLNTFFQALIGGELLPEHLMKEMKDGRKLGARDPGRYGLGLAMIDDPALGTVYGHTGGTPGYTTQSFILADGSRQVTLSVNAMPDTGRQNQAIGDAVREFLGMGTA